ncbi:hypothetical protein VP018_003063 [Morganella morganii]|nr:hypothetical protein [Morganella morganii]
MRIRNTYSKRQKQLRGELPDVYQYGMLPDQLINQISHLVNSYLGECNRYIDIKVNKKLGKKTFPDYIYEKIYSELCFALGEEKLIKINSDYNQSYEKDIFIRLRNEESIENCLDIIEILFIILNENNEEIIKNRNLNCLINHYKMLISTLNQLFRESGFGYQFEENQLIRVDSKILHSEVVKPAIYLLSSNDYYKGANEEYLLAHEHYRHKRYRDCLIYCGNSFESMLKAIHEMNEWEYDKQKDAASKLIARCFEKQLIPLYIQSQFTSLRSIIDSGVPTIRNKMGSHGKGTEEKEVTEELASYMLHLTATNLLFLADSQKAYQKND